VSTLVDPIGALAKPAKGVAFLEPTYKTCIVRSSDHAADAVGSTARNDYSRRQAFNADSTKYLVYGVDGGVWYQHNAANYAKIGPLPGLGGDAEPQWHPTNPDLLYYVPVNGVGMTLSELSVSTGMSRVVGNFGARLRARWPTAAAAWTKSEGSPSKDGRYWCFMVDAVNPSSGVWSGLGIFTWDKQTDAIIAMIDVGSGGRPDNVSMSPSGNHCLVNNDLGAVVYTRNLTDPRVLLKRSEHSDIGIDANGDDVFISIDYAANGGPVYMANLRTGERTTLIPQTYISGTATAVHISAKSFNKPGWMLLSTYADYASYGTAGRQWLHKKVMAVELKANPKIYNIAFTRAVENGYWTEPHATVNRDFTRVMFNSNWGVNSATDVDAYMVQLPPGALK
jgi:hypothetical protein